VNSFKAKLLKQKQDRESKMAGAVGTNPNDSIISSGNTASTSNLNNARNKAKYGANGGSTTATNQYSRETPAKKGFFGSVIDQSTNNLASTATKLQRPGMTSHKSSHSAIKMSSSTIGGKAQQSAP